MIEVVDNTEYWMVLSIPDPRYSCYLMAGQSAKRFLSWRGTYLLLARCPVDLVVFYYLCNGVDGIEDRGE